MSQAASERHRHLAIEANLRAGSEKIPLHEGNLAVPDLASSNTSSPYASQLIPSIRKYIEHIVQSRRLKAAVPKFPFERNTCRQNSRRKERRANQAIFQAFGRIECKFNLETRNLPSGSPHFKHVLECTGFSDSANS